MEKKHKDKGWNKEKVSFAPFKRPPPPHQPLSLPPTATLSRVGRGRRPPLPPETRQAARRSEQPRSQQSRHQEGVFLPPPASVLPRERKDFCSIFCHPFLFPPLRSTPRPHKKSHSGSAAVSFSSSSVAVACVRPYVCVRE